MSEEGMWQQLLFNKYLKNKSLAQVEAKPIDSAFWKGLMNVKNEFFKRGYFKIGDGTSVRFWEDVWMGDMPLSQQYPALYNIVQHKNVMVSIVFAIVPINISFRRGLNDQKWLQWLHLCQRLMTITLTFESDKFIWRLTDSGIFSVKSMYLDLMNGHTVYLRKYLWKIKIPLKIKIFMWFLSNKVLLTKDNLAKRKWNGCQKCCFCDSTETVNHLFIACPFIQMVWRIIYLSYNIPPPSNVTNMFGNWLNGVDRQSKVFIRIGVSALCWSIWKVRNDIIFNKKQIFHFL
jgi:hypothetical protein